MRWHGVKRKSVPLTAFSISTQPIVFRRHTARFNVALTKRTQSARLFPHREANTSQSLSPQGEHIRSARILLHRKVASTTRVTSHSLSQVCLCPPLHHPPTSTTSRSISFLLAASVPSRTSFPFHFQVSTATPPSGASLYIACARATMTACFSEAQSALCLA